MKNNENRISVETQRNLYQVIGILGILSAVESDGEMALLKKTIENCACAAEGAKALLEKAAFEIAEFCELEG